MDTCVSMANPFAAHLTLSQHWESAKPQHKIKSPLKKDTALCPPVIGPQLREWTDTSAHWQKDNPTAIKPSADIKRGELAVIHILAESFLTMCSFSRCTKQV